MACASASLGWTWIDSFSLVNRYLIISGSAGPVSASNQISPIFSLPGLRNGAGSTARPQGFSTWRVASLQADSAAMLIRPVR